MLPDHTASFTRSNQLTLLNPRWKNVMRIAAKLRTSDRVNFRLSIITFFFFFGFSTACNDYLSPPSSVTDLHFGINFAL